MNRAVGRVVVETVGTVPIVPRTPANGGGLAGQRNRPHCLHHPTGGGS